MLLETRTKVITKIRTLDMVWIYMVAIVMFKSMLFLAAIHTPHSSGINTGEMYFTKPDLMSHIFFIITIMSFAFLFKGKSRFIYYISVDLAVSMLLLADLWYYRTNGDFLSLQFIINPGLFNPSGRRITEAYPIDFLFFIDLFILVAAGRHVSILYNRARKIRNFILAFLLSIVYITASHYLIDVRNITKDSIRLFRVCWTPFQTMADLSPLGYHGYDIYNTLRELKGIKLSEGDKNEITQWFRDNQEELPDNEFKGILKGKNLIAIQVESLENFVIGEKVFGQEITPNLNRILGSSFYFNNIHEQNNGGTSSDADLMINTSLLPVREGMTFFRFPSREFNSLPKMLVDMGYSTISTHGELGGNYNWEKVHRESLKFQVSMDIEAYNRDELIRGSLSDRSLFNQFEPMLKTVKQPFYSYIVTLTTHAPFEMPEKYNYLKLPENLNSSVLGAYFQSMRYIDEQISDLLSKLEKDGLLQNSVVMIYGDHTGVHKFYNDRIKDTKLEGEWWKLDDKKIPLIIYSSGMPGRKIETIGGHIDIMPTILYLLGMEENKYAFTAMGKNLLKTERNFTVLNYGEVVGVPRDEKEKEHMLKARQISDKIITGNYFNIVGHK